MPATAVPVIERIRHWLARTGADPVADAELVRRFAVGRDEAAFAALVDRHGPLVLGVARRVLGDHHAAEDVFQATFLTLARRAPQLRRAGALAAWLHRTARNFAVSAYRARGRRDRAEARAPSRTSGSPLDDLSSRELVAVLDEELQRLPDVFRLPLVLCCLEGRSHDEAARLLGWSPGSVKGRLERGRLRLQSRLARRGLTFAIAAGVPLLAVPPAVAASLWQETLREAFAVDFARPEVAALAAGFRQPAAFSGWKTVLVVAAAVSLVGAGWVNWTGPAAERASVGRDSSPEVSVNHADNVRGEGLPAGAVARLGSNQLRIGNSAFALTPDGKTIVAVSQEGVVRRFDAATGQFLERRQLFTRSDVDPFSWLGVQLSADGRTVAIGAWGSWGKHITVRDVASGQQLSRHSSVGTLILSDFALSPDGTRLAINEQTTGLEPKQTLRVYETKTGKGKTLGNLNVDVSSIHFSGDGRRVVVSQKDAKPRSEASLVYFDVPSGKQLWKLPTNGGEFAVSPDGKTVVTTSREQRCLRVIETDLESGKTTETFKLSRQVQVGRSLLIAPDNCTVVIDDYEKIWTWNMRTGEESTRFAKPLDRPYGFGPEIGAISPDGKTVVTNLGRLQRWDLTTGKPLFVEPPDDGLHCPVAFLTFSRDGKTLFGSARHGESACWDVATGKRTAYALQQYGAPAAATADGFLAPGVGRPDVVGSQNAITLWDPVSGRKVKTFDGFEPVASAGFQAYSLTRGGRTLLVGWRGPEENRTFRVRSFDAASGRQLADPIILCANYRTGCAFSPCGHWAVVAGKVYYAGTGTELFTPTGEPGERMQPEDRTTLEGTPWFSDDGRLLAGRLLSDESADADTLAVWELASGKTLARIAGTQFVRQVAFSPDNRTVAVADGRCVRVLDLLTGKQLAEYATPDVMCDLYATGSPSRSVVFAPDGRTLASGHTDGSVLLWKVPQREPESTKAAEDADGEQRWADLASESPVTARTAVSWFAAHPAAAMALLRVKCRAEPLPPDPAVATLIKVFDNDRFTTREEATRKLVEHGSKADKPLRRLLAGTPSAEARRRAEEILPRLAAPVQRLLVSGETLRGVRAIEVLERVHTPEARKLLEAWCEPGRDARLNAEAEAAVARLGPAK